MALTPAQLTTLATDIAANTNQVGGVAINALPQTADNAFAVAAWYNLTAAPAWVVWRDLPVENVLSLITFASMTPADPVPTDTALNVAIWQARSLACQGKQFNLQNMIIGRTTAPMKKANFRAAMSDALTGLPAGASGAPIAAGWVGVRDGAKFNATNAEKLFSTGTGTTATPADLTFEGRLSDADVRLAWGI